MRDLNHPKVKSLTPGIAAALNFEPSLVSFLFSASRPACFDYWVESPDEGWTCNVPPHVDVAYPLWCTNADQTLVCVGQGRQWFMHGSHDSPETHDIATTVQGLLADLFFTLFESETTPEKLREAAACCGFRYVEDIITVGETRQDDYWNEKDRMVKEIDRKG